MLLRSVRTKTEEVKERNKQEVAEENKQACTTKEDMKRFISSIPKKK